MQIEKLIVSLKKELPQQPEAEPVCDLLLQIRCRPEHIGTVGVTLILDIPAARMRSELEYSLHGVVTQGSADIITWADSASTTDSKRLTPDSAYEECMAIEKRLDDIAGLHTRRYYYSEAMVDHPRTVRPMFSDNLPMTQKLTVVVSWGMIRKLMIKRMDLGPDQGRESREIVDAELLWLDELLSDGREFLSGDGFSRADITAASLFAPLALPKEHPTYNRLELPPNLSIDLENWKNRPSLVWIRDIYAKYR